MTLAQFFIFLATGRLLIWLIQIASLLKPIWALHPLLTELSECDVCLGFWVFLLLAIGLEPPFDYWHPVVEMIILASIASMMAHLIRLGWTSKFGVEII